MPVRSVNSLMFFCRLSPRGPLARITSSLVPAYFFQLTVGAGREYRLRPRASGSRRAGENGAAAKCGDLSLFFSLGAAFCWRG